MHSIGAKKGARACPAKDGSGKRVMGWICPGSMRPQASGVAPPRSKPQVPRAATIQALPKRTRLGKATFLFARFCLSIRLI